MGGVADVDERFVGQLIHDRAGDRQATDPATEGDDAETGHGDAPAASLHQSLPATSSGVTIRQCKVVPSTALM